MFEFTPKKLIQARKEIENLTAMNVVSMDVVAKSVHIPDKN